MNPASRFSNICVFCGSSAGVDDLYARQAELRLGRKSRGEAMASFTAAATWD